MFFKLILIKIQSFSIAAFIRTAIVNKDIKEYRVGMQLCENFHLTHEFIRAPMIWISKLLAFKKMLFEFTKRKILSFSITAFIRMA